MNTDTSCRNLGVSGP